MNRCAGIREQYTCIHAETYRNAQRYLSTLHVYISFKIFYNLPCYCIILAYNFT